MAKLPHRIIWAFAFGYFVFYAPYSGLTKSLTSSGMSGFAILSPVLAATVVSALVFLTLMGWWHHLRGMTWTSVVSGFGTALIIACTTMAYSFRGVSIVLALLLMRAGVLIMAPLIDLAFRRTVRWFSWVALGTAFTALAVSLADQASYDLTIAAGLNLAIYLSGYLLRLPCMTKCAKIDDPDCTRRYFVQELVVALCFLTVIAFVLSPQTNPTAIKPALLIGVFYTCLYVCGTLIYLDRRENTFCIALNRGASVLSGVAAAYALSTAPPTSQLVSTVLIIFALLLLSPFHHIFEFAWEFVRRRVSTTAAP